MQTCGNFRSSIGGSFSLGRRDVGRCEISTRSRATCVGRSGGGFVDDGHSRYYASNVRMGGKTVEEGKRRKKKNKKRNITKDVFDLMYMTERERSVDEIGNKGITGDLLRAQFEDLRIKNEEMRKMEKESSSSSSSSSSESSDSDCEDMMMKKRKKEVEKAMKKMMKKNKKKNNVIFENMMMIKDSSDSCDHVVPTISTSPKIEVCMGGKCKKSGAMQLKAEFEKMVGSEYVVDGCKCMGRCKEGPNIRILNHCSKEEGRNPLCIGVGLEDVKPIAATYFGKD